METLKKVFGAYEVLSTKDVNTAFAVKCKHEFLHLQKHKGEDKMSASTGDVLPSSAAELQWCSLHPRSLVAFSCALSLSFCLFLSRFFSLSSLTLSFSLVLLIPLVLSLVSRILSLSAHPVTTREIGGRECALGFSHPYLSAVLAHSLSVRIR